MRFQPRVAQRRPHLWTTRAVLLLYRAQDPDRPDSELLPLAHEMARELNNLDNQLRYNDWIFGQRQRLCGLCFLSEGAQSA